MITKLTKEQEARFSEFVEKWTRIGLSTEPANRPKAERGIIQAYRLAGLDAPRIVWCDSPLSQGLTRSMVMGEASVGASVGASVWTSVWDSVWTSVGASVRASVWTSVWTSVRDSVGASVWNSVGASVRDSVRDSVGASVRASVRDSGYGQHDASWVGFYEFFRSVCGLTTETEKLSGISLISQNAGWWLPHRNLCWISERTKTLHRNAGGLLHKDGAMALSYPDGWGIYALNGIRMIEAQVMTPAERIDPASVMAETNVDRRRELLRKVGIERMLAKLPHQSLDKRGDYELLSIKLSEQITDARYLRMLNPSVGVWHLEGVDPSCKTVTESLNWRNQQWHENAQILT